MTAPRIEPETGEPEPSLSVRTRRFNGSPYHQLVDEDGNALADLSPTAALNLAMELIQEAGTALTRPARG